jgi:glycerophosphoryl diester phosphodiesterase
VAVKTFDPAVLARFRLLAPKIPRGILARTYFDDAHWPALDAGQKHELANLLHVAETQPDFISWCVDDLPCAPAHLSRHYGGLPLIAWTVRTPEQRVRARAHADQIVFEGFSPQPENLARGGAGA